MSENMVKIERMANGFEVCFSDPDIVAANSKPSKTGHPYNYKDPKVEMVFKTSAEVFDFLKDKLDKIMPAESFDSAFMKAIQE
jgi:hypothetical protein